MTQNAVFGEGGCGLASGHRDHPPSLKSGIFVLRGD